MLGAARRLGVDSIEALHEAELLLTPKRRNDIKVGAVEDLLRRLDRQDPGKIMMWYFNGRGSGTAAEMFEAVKAWLELVLQHQADRTIGDL